MEMWLSSSHVLEQNILENQALLLLHCCLFKTDPLRKKTLNQQHFCFHKHQCEEKNRQIWRSLLEVTPCHVCNRIASFREGVWRNKKKEQGPLHSLEEHKMVDRWMLAVLKWTLSEAEQAEGHLHSCYTDWLKQCSCQEKAVCGGGNHSEQIKQITFIRKE